MKRAVSLTNAGSFSWRGFEGFAGLLRWGGVFLGGEEFARSSVHPGDRVVAFDEAGKFEIETGGVARAALDPGGDAAAVGSGEDLRRAKAGRTGGFGDCGEFIF